MKKNLLAFISFTLICSTIFAQLVPNGSFENWITPAGANFLVPQGWATYDQIYYEAAVDSFNLVTRDTTSAFVADGQYSCKIVTDSVVYQSTKVLVQSLISIGSASFDQGTVAFAGLPFPYRPDTLEFYYHYTSPGNDSGVISLRGFSLQYQEIFGIGASPLAPNTQMEKYTIPLGPFYNNTHYPDTLWFYFGSSYNHGVVGSTLWVDGVSLRISTTCSAQFTVVPEAFPHHWFTYNHASGVQPLTYNWSWGDGGTDTGATPIHVYDTSGYYNICLNITDANGCTSSHCDSSVYVFKNEEGTPITMEVVMGSATGITSPWSSAANFSLSPNPATNRLNISAGGLEITEINIYNTAGALVSQTKQPQNKSIDISQLANGIYVAGIKTKDAMVMRRWVKM